MRAKADCSLANNWHAKSNMNPTAVTNPFIFSAYSGPRQIRNGSEEKVQQSLYKIRNGVTVWSRIQNTNAGSTSCGKTWTKQNDSNDLQRKTEVQNELQVIADHLASAVGLGGRDRRTSSDTERARSAVTKCIKKAIPKIGEAIPSLGYHLAARIKTGYFCSYNPHPERPVAWKFYLEV